MYDYHGPENPDKVIVLMGSASQTATEVCDYLNSKEGYNVGVITVRLFRPWSEKHFMDIFPKSAKKVAVLDRVREEGAQGMPLYLDVNSTLRRNISEYGAPAPVPPRSNSAPLCPSPQPSRANRTSRVCVRAYAGKFWSWEASSGWAAGTSGRTK